MIKVYIAGSYSAPTIYEVRQHIRRAEDAMVELLRLGDFAPFCPHKNSGLLDGVLEDENGWLDIDLAWLRHADVAVFLPGWENSRGSLTEAIFCDENHIPAVERIEPMLYEKLIFIDGCRNKTGTVLKADEFKAWAMMKCR